MRRRWPIVSNMGIRGPGRPQHDDVLTPAEWRVAEQVRHGMTNRRIADRMGVSLDAVKFHVANALAKLGFSTRRQLQQWSGVAKNTALYRTRRLTKMANASEDSTMVLGQVARTTRHIEESRTWYRDVLGLPELFAFGNLVFFDLGGVRLMLAEEDRNSTSESILYLRVPDIHAAKEDEPTPPRSSGRRYRSVPRKCAASR